MSTRLLKDVGLPIGLIVMAYGFLQLAVRTSDTFEHDLFLLLIGSLVTIAANIAFAAITRSEGYRQGAYTERARAVQELLAKARAVKDVVVGSWHSPEDNLPIVPLRNLAFHHRVWVGDSGVEAIGLFNNAMIGLGSRRFATRPECEQAVDVEFRNLEDRLTAPLGFRAK